MRSMFVLTNNSSAIYYDYIHKMSETLYKTARKIYKVHIAMLIYKTSRQLLTNCWHTTTIKPVQYRISEAGNAF